MTDLAPDATAPRLPAPPLPLRTERLVLRAPRPTDLDALRYASDPEVARYLPFDALDEAGLAARLERMLATTAPSEPEESLTLLVEHEGLVIGDLMLRLKTRARDDVPPSVAELGWILSPDHGGRGFATEAARALVDLAFEHYPLHRVMAQLDPRNVRSARLCERLGMTLEAHLRQDWPEPDGSWSDTAVYGLLRGEWEHRRAGSG